MSRSIVISVEGNIGAGKSTLMNLLGQETDHSCFPERVFEWTSLNLFYTNPRRYAFVLQREILGSLRRIGSLLECSIQEGTATEFTFLERSAQSAELVFCELLYRLGYVSAAEYDALRFEAQALRQPDAIIYLESDPMTCYQRIQGRDGPGDQKITYAYLEKLDLQYELYLDLMEIPVLRLHAHLSQVEMRDAINRWVQGQFNQIIFE